MTECYSSQISPFYYPLFNFVMHVRMALQSTHTYTPNPTTSAPLQSPDTDTVSCLSFCLYYCEILINSDIQIICNTVTNLLSVCICFVNTLQHYSIVVEHFPQSQYSCALRDINSWNILLISTKQISNSSLCLIPSAIRTICIILIPHFSVEHSAWNTLLVEHSPLSQS